MGAAVSAGAAQVPPPPCAVPPPSRFCLWWGFVWCVVWERVFSLDQHAFSQKIQVVVECLTLRMPMDEALGKRAHTIARCRDAHAASAPHRTQQP